MFQSDFENKSALVHYYSSAKEVREEDLEHVRLGEDELEDEADDGELEEGVRDAVEHVALEPQALREAERDGHGDHDRGGQRLEHAHQEVAPEPRLPGVQLPHHQLQQRLLH
jgi:chromosome condensin MukBEF ATPase and DNA-binding subunit MukB